ncbi:protein ANTAGONIST OF LIKE HETEROCHROMATIN PROTEIN 1 [Macadamia integrifolia]|uniref:protein ANTAGONIST OF LIKE HETEROCHROMATIN PROTEIN 1 n=1 Tax=Macadamia integrifolia TaxID=60698 RepID=UPI001C528254|nr:protein ANTAGONIST OF LIKE HETEROCHROMATIN PROTEIN 1 [Macadamia integrifolia]XP_042479430.1 protein ANTAGONIST OF LIKE HETEROCHROMATIN PROTEIN 1 [Macadamia integrifolia]XP_042479431.1 protein ANTAGONIST OF LIKE HETEROCHROMATIN PROTEIN 1 [Macadamia integrifolia]
MAPPKKSKKTKKKSPTLKKSINVVPLEPKAIESDWWESFWLKNSSAEIAGSTVPSDEAEAFKYFFRVSRKTFDYICSLVHQDLVSRPPSGLINIEGRLLSVEKQVGIALRRLASGESQVSVGGAFGVGQSTVSQVTWRFIEAMEERAKHHLKWPNPDRIEEIKSKFESAFGLPNCCGAIDATHIVMTLPAVETSSDWSDRANNYSMFLQGIVDDEMRFLDIVTGWPGGMTFSRLLKCSGFFKLCESQQRLNGHVKMLSNGVEIREFIVGGAAYPLLSWLITPYGSDDLTSSMVEFNEKHKEAMLFAAKAFSQLKGAWRILHKIMWRPDKCKLPSIILVCCLLHNIIIDRGDKLQSDVPLLAHHDFGYGEESCQQVDPQGKIMIANLAKHLQNCKQKHSSN